ncbi:cyclin-L2 [Leptinotarsa decemlineata]|uniref:cyclin-L2 n=1 Tax=Leptinotarsa decemlineata TaxID=7539 RepID=UPI000C25204F|nr:cyclin-L1 [Leptinotarsa decemlineata]
MGSTKSDPLPNSVKNNGTAYGKVVITLKNQLLPEEKLSPTPSQLDGLGMDTETDLRIYGCELIQTAGILLKLPQVAMASGQVLLQRFYYSKSLVRHPVEHTAMACVCLASKIEEAPRTVRDVINVFTHIRQVNSNKPIQPVILDQSYIHLKNLVIKAERRILKELGFCVHIKHPHKIIVMYLQVLGFHHHQKLMQYSWNYMNDSLRTDVFVRYQPETVACACIYLTARKLKLPLPKNPSWFSIFGATEEDIRDISVRILKLYNRPKANIESLEKKVEDLCEKYKSARAKARGSGNDTPNNTDSSPSQQKTTGAHNAWGGFISRSGSHIAPPINEKRSRSRSATHSPDNKHRKRSKKHRSRSRSTTSRNHKKSHKRKSYSRSRSNTPPPKKKREKRKSSRSPSNDRDSKNDRYIERYEKYEKDRYKEDRDRYSEKDKYDDKKDRKDKYDRDDKYRDDKYSRDERDRYKKSKHRDEEKVESRSKDRRR